ncbi:DUF1190 domain-containing protein [Aureimonas sp. AU20]|uniref:DUF1190 domain-containing protein n=1 Tax=Aureimonas sp. AU20 TaxID=1349819 RepID=UPI0007211793|nr:DUF1190 domain-containing protein [Aureimonas sp. AU20]ALN75269.1 hypothetical protein M673_21275 [Aureimonas sp. AU20]
MRKRFTDLASGPLLALGTIAAGTLVLSRCDGGPDENTMYTSVAQCVEAGYSTGVCQSEYQAAMKEHMRSAPRFDSGTACESEYGAGHCVEVPREQPGQPGVGSIFLPLMTGYLLSSAVQSHSGYSGSYSGGYYPRSTPIFTNRSGKTLRSDPVVGTEVTPPRPANVNTRAISRGGFGGLSFGRGGSHGG